MRYILALLLILSRISILWSQFSCATAVAITSGFSTASNITTPGNNGVQDWITSADMSCGTATTNQGGFVNSDVYLFKYTTGTAAGETFYFTISYNEATYGPHSIGVWDNCTGTILSGCKISTYRFNDLVGVCAQNLAANTTYYIGVSKEWASLDGENLNFKVTDFTVELSNTHPNDDCSLAPIIGVSNSFTGSTRCNYSASAGSPSVCGMSIENDSWVRFIASSSTVVIDYSVTGCTNNLGVQLSVFSGNCSALNLVSGTCLNYALNNSVGTYTLNGLTIGQTYYLRADGYAGDLCSYTYNAISGVTTPTALPVELQYFDVQCKGENVLVHWKTLSEQNSNLFLVEKSQDGYNWKEVGELDGAGHSQESAEYFLEDESVVGATVYYRLVQKDINGVRRVFEPVSLTCGFSELDWQVYPNPSMENFNVLVNALKADELINVRLFNETGQLLYSKSVKLIPGMNTVQLKTESLANGVYLIQVSGDNRVNRMKKCIKE